MTEKDKWIVDLISTGRYEVLRNGVVISHAYLGNKGKSAPLRLNINSAGYANVSMQNAIGEKRLCRLHRVVALIHIPNPDNLPEVNHIDGDKLNNSVENLEWVSRSQNERHAIKHGLKSGQVGETNPQAKLTESDARQVKLLAREGKISQKRIAEMFHIKQTTVSNINTGKIWGHL